MLGQGQKITKESGILPSTFDPLAQDYFDRVFAATGVQVPGAVKTKRNNGFIALQNSAQGNLLAANKIVRLHATVGLSEPQARIDLTSGNKTIIPTGTPTYSSVTGYDTQIAIPRATTGYSIAAAGEFWLKSNNSTFAGPDVNFSGNNAPSNFIWFAGTCFPSAFSGGFNSFANTTYDKIIGFSTDGVSNSANSGWYVDGVRKAAVTLIADNGPANSIFGMTSVQGFILNCMTGYMTAAEVAEMNTILLTYFT